jgi:hypothetical protein
VIVSTAAGLPDLDPTTQRLLRSQEDIGDAISPYYGEDAEKKLTGLLRTHILGAAAVLAAAKGNNSASLDSAKTAWYANANDIADFLSAANQKFWPKDKMRGMMKEHRSHARGGCRSAAGALRRVRGGLRQGAGGDPDRNTA